MATFDSNATMQRAPAAGARSARRRWLALAALLVVWPHAVAPRRRAADRRRAHPLQPRRLGRRCRRKEAIALLRKAGVKRALVSSSSDDGTQRLLAEAPDLIVPGCGPIAARRDRHLGARRDGHRATSRSGCGSRYAAIGEFHLYGADADLPVPRRMVQLAKQHELMLHAHSDADAVERLFKQDPEARILWAHSGFDRPETGARDAAQAQEPVGRPRLPQRPRRRRQGARRSGATLFIEFPDRFMVGTDTFTPERWHYVVEHAAWSRAWLADLPPALAERIAWRNGEALFAGWTPGPGK